MRNTRRSVLRRRRFLQSSSIILLGAAGSLLTGRKLVRGSARPHSAAAPSADPEPVVVSSRHEEPYVDPPDPAPMLAEEPYGPPPRPLSDEERYAQFLASLDLQHITPHEVIHPHRARINDVANQLPPEDLWEKLVPTLKVADMIRERLGTPLLKITSAYRCPRYNMEIPGAASRSYHVKNQALDLVFGGSNRKAWEVARRLRNERFFRGGIGLYPTFIHVDTRGYDANWRG